jgi:hypothetical protein
MPTQEKTMAAGVSQAAPGTSSAILTNTLTLAQTKSLPSDLSKCWTVFYRHGVNATLTKNFYFDGAMRDAIERAQQHCGIMGYKYIFIRPMICDIEHEENVQLGRIDARTGRLKEEGTGTGEVQNGGPNGN